MRRARWALSDLEGRLRPLRGETEVDLEEEEDDEDEERDDPEELLPLELLPLELLPLAALLDLELLDEAVRFFLVRSRPRSFLASADRTRLGLAAITCDGSCAELSEKREPERQKRRGGIQL